MTRCRFKSYWKDDSQYKDWIASREQKERGRRKRRGENMKEEKKRGGEERKGAVLGVSAAGASQSFCFSCSCSAFMKRAPWRPACCATGSEGMVLVGGELSCRVVAHR